MDKAYRILCSEAHWQGSVPSPATVSRRMRRQDFDIYMARFFRALCLPARSVSAKAGRMAVSHRVGDLHVLVIDSTAIEAPRDPHARWGHTREGPFLGYKLHLLVNSRGVPVAAWVSQGHRSDHDGLRPMMRDAKQVLATNHLRGRVKFVLADAGYDAEEHYHLTYEATGARLLAQDNPRNRKVDPADVASKATLAESAEPTPGVRRDAFRLLKTDWGKKLMAKRSEIERVFSQVTDPGGINCEQLPRQIRGKKKVRRFLLAKAIQYTCGIVDNTLSGRKARTMAYAA